MPIEFRLVLIFVSCSSLFAHLDDVLIGVTIESISWLLNRNAKREIQAQELKNREMEMRM